MPLESQYERIIRDYPNLLDSRLASCPPGRLGARGTYYLQQESLANCGRLDLAFVTGDTVVLVEMKREIVDPGAVEQIRRYMAALRYHYPDHGIVGYLVGNRCPIEQALKAAIGEDAIHVKLFGRDIPLPGHITGCHQCGRAFHRHGWCEHCGP